MGQSVYDGNRSRRWEQFPPCEHLVQFYAEDNALLDCLAGFVAGGLRSGEAVILVLTPGHREALEERLLDYETLGQFSLAAACARDQYIALDAAETLASFMVDGAVNETLFMRVVSATVDRGRAAGWWGGDGRRVRVFGEMVALLWAQGNTRATIQLERAWCQLCREQGFSLLCAYPRSLFRDESEAAEISSLHSGVLG